MLFSDIDDTLLGKDLKISNGNKKAIMEAQENGVKFVICTGRAVYSIKRYVEELGLKGKNSYAVCQNGGTVYDLHTGKLLIEKSFSSKDIKDVIDIARKYCVDIQLYYDSKFMLEKLTKRTKEYSKNMNTPITMFEDLKQYEGKLTKCLLNGEPQALKKVEEEAKDVILGKLNMFFSNPNYLEFTSVQATKGTSMLDLAEKLNVKQSEIIAVGDSYNDLHMIKLAGLGVSVANGVQEIKDAADYVTKEDCNGSPIKEIIDKFIFNRIY